MDVLHLGDQTRGRSEISLQDEWASSRRQPRSCIPPVYLPLSLSLPLLLVPSLPFSRSKKCCMCLAQYPIPWLEGWERDVTTPSR